MQHKGACQAASVQEQQARNHAKQGCVGELSKLLNACLLDWVLLYGDVLPQVVQVRSPKE